MRIDDWKLRTFGEVVRAYEVYGHCQQCGRCVPLGHWHDNAQPLFAMEAALRCSHCGTHNAKLLLKNRLRGGWLPYKPLQIDEPDLFAVSSGRKNY